MMTELQSQITTLWIDSSKAISQRFGLKTPPTPELVQVIDTCDISRFGGQHIPDKNKIQICAGVLQGEIPLAGIIHRECLLHSLPSKLCFEAVRDIAMEFARQMIRQHDRIKWLQQWQKIPTERVHVNLLYTSYRMMDWIITLGGLEQLDSLVHEFVSMARYGISFDFNEYVEYMFLRTQNIAVELGPSDVKILDILLKDETASYHQVAEMTGLSEPWVCTRINRLRKKYVLTDIMTTPFSRIGIRTFYILLAGPSRSEPSKILDECPFVYEIRSILNGPWQIIARLAVPDNVENTQSLRQMSSILNDNGIAVDIAETHSVGISSSFYHYDARNHKWEIPWISMRGWGNRISEESLHRVINRIDLPAKTTDLYLDSLDMEILALVQDGVTSSRALRRRLSIGQTKLLARIKRLKSEDLMHRIWSVQNIGLIERVALRAIDKETAGILDIWSRELPRTFLRYEENRSLLMMTDLPAGGSTQLMDTIRSLMWPISISPLSSGIWGHWQFPYDHWDVEKQCWKSPKEEIITWLERIAEVSENLSIESPTYSSGPKVSRRVR